jgi:hypothetical protein
MCFINMMSATVTFIAYGMSHVSEVPHSYAFCPRKMMRFTSMSLLRYCKLSLVLLSLAVTTSYSGLKSCQSSLEIADTYPNITLQLSYVAAR